MLVVLMNTEVSRKHS